MQTSSLRDSLKKIPGAISLYYVGVYGFNVVNSWYTKLFITIFMRKEASLLKDLPKKVVAVHSKQELNLSNKKQYYVGKNILGYPALSYIEKNGKMIGWSDKVLERNGETLPFLQVTPDIEINIPLIFETLKPDFVIDFGTASGGSAVYYYELISKYTTPHILTIDITDADVVRGKAFHDKNKSFEKISFLTGKSGLDRVSEVQAFLANRTDEQKVLFSFDDDHSYQHTYNELTTFAPLLKTGDVILMQDTWDQGLYNHETSPMLAVERFLQENNDFLLDIDLLSKLELPSNFIYGVLVKI